MTSSTAPLRGFTLVELLSVIAIIGVMASVVVVSLGTARAKGIDAGIKQALSGARSQAEIYYTANGGNYYSGACTQTVSGTKGINEIVAGAAKSAGIFTLNTAIGTAGSSGTVTCHDSALGWAAEVPLKTPGQGFFCVDSTLYAGTSSVSTLPANDIQCGP